MAEQNLSVIIKLVDKASAELKSVWKNINSFVATNKKTLDWLQKYWAVATVAIWWAILALADNAAKAQEIEQAFQGMSKSVWASSEDILTSLKKASKWAINDTDLMLAANKGMTLWVASNTEEFTTLMEIARVKAKTMWLTTQQAFDDIVTGLGRGSVMILDNLGITISATEAQEEYAKLIGKVASELTEWEKKQALINKVVKEWKEELLAMWEVTTTLSEKKQILNAQISNLSNEIGNAFLPIMSDLLDKFVPVVDSVVLWASKNPELITQVAWFGVVVWWLAVVAGTLWLALPAIVTWFTLMTWPIWLAWAAIWIWVSNIKYIVDNIWDIKSALSFGNLSGMNSRIAKKALQQVISPGLKWVPILPEKQFSLAWARADWWPVMWWSSYLVWERWPEIFTPKTSWGITPNNAIWGISISFGTVNINNWRDENRLAQFVEKNIVKAIKWQSLWYL